MFFSYTILSIIILAASQCCRACSCTDNFKPVCGSDYVTYANKCHLRCAQQTNPELKQKLLGQCKRKHVIAFCNCNSEDDPVCGSDGQTYINKCHFECEHKMYRRLTLEKTGPCKPEASYKCLCTLDYIPVCGTDGKTYKNECALRCVRSVKLAHTGECQEKVKRQADSCSCARNTDYVCGSDGKTYNNHCMLLCAAKNHKDLKVTKFSRCGEEEQFEDHVQDVHGSYRPGCGPCTRNLMPVCASDGKTYSNECVMHCTARQPNVSVVKQGICA